MKQNWRIWLYGLAHAFIGAATSSAAAALVDPAKFNLTREGLKALALTALSSGAVAAIFYLERSPMPSLTETTEVVKEISASDGSVTTTRTLTVVRKRD